MKKRRGAPKKSDDKKAETAWKNFLKVVRDPSAGSDVNQRQAKFRLEAAFAAYAEPSSSGTLVVTKQRFWDSNEANQAGLALYRSVGYKVEIARPRGRAPGIYHSPEASESKRRMQVYADRELRSEKVEKFVQRATEVLRLCKERRTKSRPE